MTHKNNNKIISVVHPICCGWDVHKDMVSACIKHGRSFVDLGQAYLMWKSKQKGWKLLKSEPDILVLTLCLLPRIETVIEVAT